MTEIFQLKKEDIFFVFIDLQEKLLAHIPETQRLVGRNSLVAQAARLLNWPLIASTQYKKGLGEVVPELRAYLSSDIPDKTSFSCCQDPKIADWFERIGRRTAILSGIETHICVLQTALDLLGRDFKVAVIADAVASRNPEDHVYGLRRLERSGATIVTTEMLIYELLKQSDTEEFKKVLPLIKGKEKTITGFLGD